LLEEIGEGGARQGPDHHDEPRGHERDEHPPGDIAAIVVTQVEKGMAERLTRACQLCQHVISFRGRLGRPQPRPSRSMKIPGKIAKMTDKGRTRKTSGMSMRISFRPACSISDRFASSRASPACA